MTETGQNIDDAPWPECFEKGFFESKRWRALAGMAWEIEEMANRLVTNRGWKEVKEEAFRVILDRETNTDATGGSKFTRLLEYLWGLGEWPDGFIDLIRESMMTFRGRVARFSILTEVRNADWWPDYLDKIINSTELNDQYAVNSYLVYLGKNFFPAETMTMLSMVVEAYERVGCLDYDDLAMGIWVIYHDSVGATSKPKFHLSCMRPSAEAMAAMLTGALDRLDGHPDASWLVWDLDEVDSDRCLETILRNGSADWAGIEKIVPPRYLEDFFVSKERLAEALAKATREERLVLMGIVGRDRAVRVEKPPMGNVDGPKITKKAP